MQERVSNIAYNISNGLCDPVIDQSAPVYITIGDGGNLEGLVYEYVNIPFSFHLFPILLPKLSAYFASFYRTHYLIYCLCRMTKPQPKYSAYREASFGHGILDIKNRTHAYFGWHRNQDEYDVEADSLWLYNRYWHPIQEDLVASL